ncbi:TolC family protein [Haliangium sp.]|uniref:TolC family protein n=1 Tax=Haliangium sp. TaxID=2663208 RepID=UPI003D10709D
MSKNLAALVAALSLTASTAMAQAPGEEAPAEQRMTLAECVELALQRNQELVRTDAVVAEAEAGRLSARGRYGPLLRVDASVSRWGDSVEFTLDPAAPPLVVRDQITSQVSGSLIQPLTGLWAIHEGYKAQTYGHDAAQHEQTAARHDVVMAVADAYYQALGAEQLAEIAELSVRQIEAHVEQARAFHRSGLIGKNQVLEAEVRLSEVRASLVRARGGVTLARANLAFQMGLPADRQVFPAPIPETEPVSIEQSYEDAAAEALTQRSELSAIASRVEQAQAGSRAARAQMLPQLSAILNATHVEGQALARANDWFVGLQLEWNVWEWGSTYYQSEQARARVAQAEAGQAHLREAVQLQVRRAYVELRSAEEQLRATRDAVAQAEENLRIQQSRFEANAATTTEVLDAEALLARARVNVTTSFYAYLRAMTALKRALGEMPVAATATATSRRD